MAEQKTNCVIGPVMLNYPALFKPRKQMKSDKLKYEVDILIDKKTQKDIYAEVMICVKAAWAAGKEKHFKGKQPKEIRDFFNPLRDGDKEKEDREEYKGKWFIKAKSDQPPGVVKLVPGGGNKPIIDESEIYSGVIAYLSLNFFPFSEGGKGIACGLNNVLKYKDGNRLSGRKSAKEDFAGLDLEVEDEVDFDEDFDFTADEDDIPF